METSKILIVEDERIVALSVKDILNSEKYDVCSIVNSAKKAIEEIDYYRPNLVVMDIKIKGEMDGIELAKYIKNEYLIPSVFLTAYSDNILVERAKVVEPLGYILKPFNKNEIISTVKIALYKSVKEKNEKYICKKLEDHVKESECKLNNEKIIRKNIEKELQMKSCFLQEANKALKVLLETRDAENRACQENIFLNIRNSVFPYLDILKKQNVNENILELIDILENSLKNTLCTKTNALFAKYADLTPQEVKIADLVRQGKTTKEIAKILNIASCSVSTHRYNIRKKIGILNSNTNLERYLNFISHSL